MYFAFVEIISQNEFVHQPSKTEFTKINKAACCEDHKHSSIEEHNSSASEMRKCFAARISLCKLQHGKFLTFKLIISMSTFCFS